MSLLRITCPECGAGLKSASGFSVGQSIQCPKCESEFTVEEPEGERPRKSARAAAADDEDDRPRNRKKKHRDEEGSYRNSPLRFAVLAVLLIIMLVLGYMLYEKRMREAEAGNAQPSSKQNLDARM